jgi:hypothetical protein
MALSQWLPQSRRGGGEYNTGNITIPTGFDTVHIQLDVNPVDFTTPDLSVTASVEISTDGAQTWVHQMSVGWVGVSPPPGKSGTWYAYVNGISIYAGALARVHFSTSGTFRWGLLGELI